MAGKTPAGLCVRVCACTCARVWVCARVRVRAHACACTGAYVCVWGAVLAVKREGFRRLDRWDQDGEQDPLTRVGGPLRESASCSLPPSSPPLLTALILVKMPSVRQVCRPRLICFESPEDKPRSQHTALDCGEHFASVTSATPTSS